MERNDRNSGLRPQQQLWDVFSHDHSNEKKVIFDIFFWKKQRERMPNLKLNKRCAALTNEKNGVRFIFHWQHLHKKEADTEQYLVDSNRRSL